MFHVFGKIVIVKTPYFMKKMSLRSVKLVGQLNE